jgi:hypothetical protein
LIWLEPLLRPKLEGPFQERTADQVAQELKIPKAQVYVAKKRVLDRLEQEHKELAHDSGLLDS